MNLATRSWIVEVMVARYFPILAPVEARAKAASSIGQHFFPSTACRFNRVYGAA